MTMKVELIRCTADPEWLIEFAGRLCYGGECNGDSEFIKKRIEAGHESIIEHAVATFEISGISRACSHQLVRHRIASFSQESQRYVEPHVDTSWGYLLFEVVIPPSIADTKGAREIWAAALAMTNHAYDRLRDMGIPKEDARFLLPNATATRLVVTMNFRELRHFFKVRLAKQAQWEIRELAGKMLKLVRGIAPNVFEDIEE